ncbi:hypothetical protein HPP92_024868 [Vanilla planifolia]|uniref:Uncharacterized protein n=1 Tax=Vanilla planifolia TaxID=51239 RepID=A0A835UDN9_VANPL|nr:hypothetical protein HPP92_024868 [Vanilla planifolia]
MAFPHHKPERRRARDEERAEWRCMITESNGEEGSTIIAMEEQERAKRDED